MPLDHHLFLEEIKMAHRYPKPLLDTLYCLKDHIHWEEEQVEDDEYSSSTTTTITNTNTDTSSVVFLEHDLFWDREELSSLLAKEHTHPNHTQRHTHIHTLMTDRYTLLIHTHTHPHLKIERQSLVTFAGT